MKVGLTCFTQGRELEHKYLVQKDETRVRLFPLFVIFTLFEDVIARVIKDYECILCL